MKGHIFRWVLPTLAALAFGIAPAQAAFPGQNGKIAFVRAGDIWTMDPDGSGQVNLTNSAAAEDNPAWSAPGNRIAFDSGGQLWTMFADGTGATQLTSGPSANGGGRAEPSWSPDGTKLAFVQTGGRFIATINSNGTGEQTIFFGSDAGGPSWSPDGSKIALHEEVSPFPSQDCGYDVFTVEPDGSDVFNVTQCGGGDPGDDLRSQLDPNWSPDNQWIAFSYGCPPCTSARIDKIKPDGTGRATVYPSPAFESGYKPAWSPNGTRIAFSSESDGRIGVVSADGTNFVDLTDGAKPDWQPIPINFYARPKGATPFRASLAIAYQPCVSPNRTHGPPLAFPACNPPQQTSSFLTVGTADANARPALNEGYLKLDAIPGVPGGLDDADVRLDFFMDDVFTKPGLVDYAGELRANVVLQITDKDNGVSPGGTDAATTTPIPLNLTVPCTAVADPSEGSSCAVTTSGDALMLDAVKESRRTIWQVSRTEVYDGGADGDAQTPASDTLFATQGIFIP